jgi:hypothetical protein
MTLAPVNLKVLFGIIVVLVILLIWRSLKNLSSAPAYVSSYDWHELLLENGKASPAAHVLLGSYIVMTWFFVYYALLGKMTEGYAGIYVTAWVAPAVARLIFNPRGAPELADDRGRRDKQQDKRDDIQDDRSARQDQRDEGAGK